MYSRGTTKLERGMATRRDNESALDALERLLDGCTNQVNPKMVAGMWHDGLFPSIRDDDRVDMIQLVYLAFDIEGFGVVKSEGDFGLLATTDTDLAMAYSKGVFKTTATAVRVPLADTECVSQGIIKDGIEHSTLGIEHGGRRHRIMWPADTAVRQTRVEFWRNYLELRIDGTLTPTWEGDRYTGYVQGPSESTVPAGWFPDPRGVGRLRYWDGAAWTDHTAE